jgi:hypothetical protein
MIDLINELVLPGEEYFLEHKEATGQENDLGDAIVDWVEVQELSGIVQKKSTDPANTEGHNELGDYYGFFEPNFTIPENELGDYRVKHIFPSVNPFIRYFEISSIDRNLRLDNEIHHFEMELKLAKKW